MSRRSSLGTTRNPKVPEGVRKRAVGLVRGGRTQASAAESLGVEATTVWKWMRLFRTGGEEALAARVGQGRPPKLSGEQRAELRQTIIEKTPKAVGLGAELWTLPLLAQHIRAAFGVAIDPSNISRLLAKMGITPQRPCRRAVGRDEAECDRWMKEEFPRIAREAEQAGATLLFEDETGVHENTPLATTWGLKGQRPVVPVPGTRRRVNVISALSPGGLLWFRCYQGYLNAVTFVAFLVALLRDVRGQIVLILDRHPAHVAKLTTQYIEKRKNRLTVHFLPSYAPDLNPDEHVWGQLKGRFRRHPLAAQDDMAGTVHQAMQGIKKDRRFVRNLLHHPESKYILKALADAHSDGSHTIS